MLRRFACAALVCALLVPVQAGAEQGRARQSLERKPPLAGYVGNRKSRIYHNSACRYFTCKNCTVRFSSPDEARKRGFVACKICGG